MDPATAIVLKTFPDMSSADVAAGQLRSYGIECQITADDCGGMYPSLGLIKLLVDPAQAGEARGILQQPSRVPATHDQSTGSQTPHPPPPRVYRFNWGLVAGAIIGSLLHLSYTRYWQHRDGTYRYDRDGDGVDEEEQIWRGGNNVETRLDRNGDQQVDWWMFYRNNVAVREEVDDNFDGRIDGWFTHSPKGFPIRSEIDSDCNGIRDAAMIYTNGIPAQADWRPNGTNVILLRQVYRQGVLEEEIRDTDGDGRFDVSVRFNAFNTPISTNYFVIPVRPAP